MTCSHVHVGEACVTLCGPTGWVEFRRTPDRVRWCFQCRKHLMHDFVVAGEPGPSWYGPTPSYSCHGCGEDHTLGFGMEREWSE